MESIKKIINGIQSMLQTSFQIIPEYIFISVLCIIIMIGIYLLVKSPCKRKKKIYLALGAIYLVLGTTIVCIFPHIMEATAAIWFVPRSNYAIASLIGLLLLYTYMNTKTNKRVDNVLLVVIIVYLAIQYNGFQNIIRDNYIVSYQDQSICEQIYEKVIQYEKEKGIKVNKVAFYFNRIQYSYPHVYTNGDTNIKAMCTDWSRLNALNYYTNANLVEIPPNEEIYNEYFKEKQWENFDNEQVVLLEDTLHLYLY